MPHLIQSIVLLVKHQMTLRVELVSGFVSKWKLVRYIMWG